MTPSIRFSVSKHPYVPGRWTHLILAADARACGWMTAADLPLGTWLSRESATRQGRKLSASGRFILNTGGQT